MVQMLGWFSAEANRASRASRALAVPSAGSTICQHLQRHHALELRISRPIHDAHSARADSLQDLVVDQL